MARTAATVVFDLDGRESPDLEESALGLRLPGIGKATVRSSLEVMCSYHFAVAASCCYLRAHCLAQSAVPASA
jgi:hypothetical protein